MESVGIPIDFYRHERLSSWQHVDYLEKTSAAAKIPGGYFKREGTGCVLGLVLLGGRGLGGRGNDLAA
jgi:hypothetical protein